MFIDPYVFNNSSTSL